MVGPFIFFDQMGPAELLTGQGIDVRPHPHIGLATVTYLYRGEILHRDSVGSEQIIRPGAVNWMVAGRGITHSERTPDAIRAAPHGLLGIQTWVALPEEHEDADPSFEHHPESSLPLIDNDGARVRLLLGDAYGERAPAAMPSRAFYADVALEPGSRLPLPDDQEERAFYIVEGSVAVAGETYPASRMVVLRPGDRVVAKAGERGARLMLLGGDALEGPRFIWWNFVATSRERIEHAEAEWRAGRWGEGRFDLPAGDRDEFIPLPE